MTREHRSYSLVPQLRSKGSRTIGGLAIPFNIEEELWPGTTEVWMPGSISYSSRGVKLFYAHNPSQVLASTDTGRLRLSIRSDGLHYEADLPETTLGDDLLELISLREIRGVSPGFLLKPSGTKIEKRKTETVVRIFGAEVFEISLTPIPAYGSTTASLRSTPDPEKLSREKTLRAAIIKGLRTPTLTKRK